MNITYIETEKFTKLPFKDNHDSEHSKTAHIERLSETLFNSERKKEDFKLLPIIHSSFYVFLPHILKGRLLV